MQTESFKITNVADAIRMMEKTVSALKVVGFCDRLNLTRNRNYKVAGTKIVKGRHAFDTYYLVTNNKGMDVWVSAEYIELI